MKRLEAQSALPTRQFTQSVLANVVKGIISINPAGDA